MKKSAWMNLVAALAAVIVLGCFPAAAQTAETPAAAAKKPAVVSAPKHHSRSSRKISAANTAHVYLLRGLANIFSLGMDELGEKIERMGIAVTVTNHSEWQELCDKITAQYKAGNHGSIILIGHSLGADAVMLMGERLGQNGVPVALIVPFDGTRSRAASGNVARVMNITQRDYAYMTRGYGFRGELSNIDVSGEPDMGHISIDKSPRLQDMVLKKIASIVKKNERGKAATEIAAPAAHDQVPPVPKPAPLPVEMATPQPATGAPKEPSMATGKAAVESSPASTSTPTSASTAHAAIPPAIDAPETPAAPETPTASPAAPPPIPAVVSSDSETAAAPHVEAPASAPAVQSPAPPREKINPAAKLPLEFQKLGPQ